MAPPSVAGPAPTIAELRAILESGALDAAKNAVLERGLRDPSVPVRRAAMDTIERLVRSRRLHRRRELLEQISEARRQWREHQLRGQGGVEMEQRHRKHLAELEAELAALTAAARPRPRPRRPRGVPAYFERTDAMAAAARRAAVPLVPVVIRALQDADPRVVDNARRALESLGGLAAPAMVRAFASANAAVRSALTHVAYRVGPEMAPVVPALRDALAGATAEARRTYASAIGEIGVTDANTAGVLAGLLADPDQQVVWPAAKALRRSPNAAAQVIPALAEVVTGRVAGPVGRREACWILALVGPPAADVVPGLVKAAAGDPDPEVRANALAALGAINVMTAEVFNALRGGVEDPDPRPCEAALTACGLLRRQAVAILEWALAHPRPAVPDLAAKALRDMGAEAKPAEDELIALLADPPRAQAWWYAVEALVNLEADAKILFAALRGKLKDPVHHQRRGAVALLGKMGPRAAPMLRQVLERLWNDGDETVRANAAEVLPLIAREDPRVVPALARACGDDGQWVRRAAAASLASYGPAALPAAEALARSAARRSRTTAGECEAAFSALIAIGDAALPVLHRLRKSAGTSSALRDVLDRAIARITASDH